MLDLVRSRLVAYSVIPSRRGTEIWRPEGGDQAWIWRCLSKVLCRAQAGAFILLRSIDPSVYPSIYLVYLFIDLYLSIYLSAIYDSATDRRSDRSPGWEDCLYRSPMGHQRTVRRIIREMLRESYCLSWEKRLLFHCWGKHFPLTWKKWLR